MTNDVRLLIDENQQLERELDLAGAKIVALERELSQWLSQWRNGAKSFAVEQAKNHLAPSTHASDRIRELEGELRHANACLAHDGAKIARLEAQLRGVESAA